MSDHADACIAYFDERKLDITVLWLLQHWDWLDTFVFGRKLVAFIERTMRLRRNHVARREFHERVTNVFLERGVQKLCPERVVQAYRKEELFKLCCDAKWPEPFFPFMLQMRPGIFALFANWQDGFYWILEKTGKRVHTTPEGRNIPVDLLYENQIIGLGEHGDFPSQMIIDFDAYVNEFGGALTMPDLEALMASVLPWFAGKLVEIGAIGRDQTLTAVVKKKSRTGTSKGDKVSCHCIINLLEVSTRGTREILRKVFIEQFAKERKIQKEKKSMQHVEMGSDACLALLADSATMHGRNQFSVLFCGKAGESPPKLTRIVKLGDGGKRVQSSPWRWVDDEHLPTHEHALEMLFHACYSCMNMKTVIPNARFLIAQPEMAIQAKKRAWEGSGAEPSTPSSRKTGTSVRQGFLPPWVESAIARGSGLHNLNTTMQCLEVKYARLKEYVPDVQREDMAHIIAAIPCPVQALHGKIQVHASNGVFIASSKNREVMYAMCSNCSLSGEDINTKKSLASVVEGMEKSCHPWVKYTEEAFDKMIRKPKKADT